MPAPTHHAQLLESALRESAALQLAWLRDENHVYELALDGSIGPRAAPAYLRLGSQEGQERLEEALRERHYSADELRFLPQQLAELDRAEVLREGRRWLTGFLGKTVAVGSEARSPADLLSWLADDRRVGYGPSTLVRALDEGLDAHASFCLDLRARADYAYETRLTSLQLMAADKPDPEAPPEPPRDPHEPEPVVLPVPSTLERAQRWLEQTDDAARELTTWLVKRSEQRGEDGLGDLFSALRARHFDGLARPHQRLHRLAQGARRLGFERDMGARMHAELGQPLLLPMVSCVARDVPHDVRLIQGSIDYGLLSDLAAAQGIGEALMLALVSPTLSPVLRRPLGVSVSAAMGGLFLQLRAEPGYLRRVDGLDKDPAGQVARHSALWMLLRSRLAAALVCAQHAPVRSNEERLSQLTAAGERALGRELPRGIAAATLLATRAPAEEFEALLRGFELHVALRERFDADFYVNPRVSEVFRGAAARGNLLDAAGFAAELGVKASGGLARLFELLA